MRPMRDFFRWLFLKELKHSPTSESLHQMEFLCCYCTASQILLSWGAGKIEHWIGNPACFLSSAEFRVPQVFHCAAEVMSMLYSNINCNILCYNQKLQLRYIHRPYVNKIIYTLCVLFPTSSLFFWKSFKVSTGNGWLGRLGFES